MDYSCYSLHHFAPVMSSRKLKRGHKLKTVADKWPHAEAKGSRSKKWSVCHSVQLGQSLSLHSRQEIASEFKDEKYPGWVHIQSAKFFDEDLDLVPGCWVGQIRTDSLCVMYNVTAKEAFSSLLYFRTDNIRICKW